MFAGRLMDNGLFHLCRHPNYFGAPFLCVAGCHKCISRSILPSATDLHTLPMSGEILVWTSLTVLAGTSGVMRAHPWIMASPLFTSLLLIFVSGKHTPLVLWVLAASFDAANR